MESTEKDEILAFNSAAVIEKVCSMCVIPCAVPVEPFCYSSLSMARMKMYQSAPITYSACSVYVLFHQSINDSCPSEIHFSARGPCHRTISETFRTYQMICIMYNVPNFDYPPPISNICHSSPFRIRKFLIRRAWKIYSLSIWKLESLQIFVIITDIRYGTRY